MTPYPVLRDRQATCPKEKTWANVYSAAYSLAQMDWFKAERPMKCDQKAGRFQRTERRQVGTEEKNRSKLVTQTVIVFLYIMFHCFGLLLHVSCIAKPAN